MDASENFEKESSEMGFVSVALVIYAPLLVAVLACLSIVFCTLYFKTAADRACKVEALKLQKNLGVLMEKLLAMNKEAQKLRVEREAAEQAVRDAKASLDPEALAAALEVRAAVIAAQTAFAIRQASLLTQANAERGRSSAAMSHYVKHFGILATHSELSSHSLAVTPTPTDSLSPDYEAIPDFKQAQRVTYHYRQNILAMLPDWLHPYAKAAPSLETFAAVCSATLEQREKKWAPILNAARP
jgi:hypothetical protein